SAYTIQQIPLALLPPGTFFLTRAVAPYLLIETVGNTPMHTIATAAAAVGRNKTAILRAIKAGKISVAKDENGEWQIDPAELHRIYPPLRSAHAGQRYAAAPASVAVANASLRITARAPTPPLNPPSLPRASRHKRPSRVYRRQRIV